MLSRLRSISVLPPMLAALMALGLYAVTLGGSFVFDDAPVVLSDPRVRGPGHWTDFLTQGYWQDSADPLWRPLVSYSYLAEYRLHGAIAWPYHLVNVLLHAGACALVALLAWRLAASRRAGLIAGLLFAAHPLHVDAVAYVVGRAELLCAIGVLGALALVIGTTMTRRRHAERALQEPFTCWRAAGVFGCFLVAIFSKEQGMLLAPLLLGWVWLRKMPPASWLAEGRQASAGEYRGPQGGPIRLDYAPREPWNKDSVPSSARNCPLLLCALLAGTLAVCIYYRDHIVPWDWDAQLLDWTVNPLVRSSGADRWLIPIAVIGRYATLLALPWRFSIDYGAVVFMPTINFRQPYFYTGILVLAVYFAGAVYLWRRRNGGGLFCLLGLGLTGAMVSNVVLIGTVFGERLMYLPSAFALILVAMFTARLPKKFLVPTLCIVLALLSLRTLTYARIWNDRLQFYQTSVRQQPRSVTLRLLLAQEWGDRASAAESCGNQIEAGADWEQCMAVLAGARELVPDYWKAWYNSAAYALEQGSYEEARRFMERAFKLSPERFPAGGLLLKIDETIRKEGRGTKGQDRK